MNIQGFSPIITAPLQAQAAQKSASTSNASGTSSNTSSSTGGLSATNLEGTFLNLLATELQNQDPTSPVDPTQMVGQLVSLNQLDQLISINQTLSNLGGSGATPTASSSTTSSQGGAQNELGAPGIGSISQSGPQNELGTPGIGNLSKYAAAASHVPSISQALGLFQPGNAAAAGANALMNLYGSFTAPAQTQQLSAGGR